MVIEQVNYVFIGVLGFIAFIWGMASMGVIAPRDGVHEEKQRRIEDLQDKIEQTYFYLESLPEHSRSKVRDHLDNGMVHHALDEARSHHDVYYFFKNFG